MSAFSEQSFRLQEAARERNKQEQRKLTCNLKGKSGPEAVYRFNLEKLNQEQRLIARDLGRMKGAGRINLAAQTMTPLALNMAKEERMIEKQLQVIRQGVHKHPGSQSLLTPDKKFHHPDFPLLFTDGLEKHPSRSSYEGSNHVKSKNKFDDEIRQRKLPLNRDDSDVNGFMIMEYLDNIHNTAEQDKTSRNTDILLNPSVNQTSINDSSNCQVGENNTRKRNEFDNKIEGTRANHLGNFMNSPNSTTGTGRFVSSGIDLGSRRQLDSKDQTPQRKSLSGGALRTNVQTDFEDFRAFSEEEMSKIRTDSNRRLSKDTNSDGMKKSSSKNDVKFSSSKADNKNSMTKSIVSDVLESKSRPVAAADVKEETTNDNTKPERRLSKTQALEELLKRPMHDPETHNPDGTLKTMHTMPSFEERWEQARNARYVRTNEPMERDRELTTREIFDKMN